MALHPSLTTTGFWNQSAQMALKSPPPLSVPSQNALGYGMTADNLCLPCSTTGLDSLCSTPGPTGATNPIVPCKQDQLYHCQHATLEQCYGNATKAGLVHGLSAQPYHQVIQTAFSQPTYGSAFQTMMAGRLA